MTDSAGSDKGDAAPPPQPELVLDEGDIASDFFRALGRQVRVLRERKGWSRRELGSRVGYGEDQIMSLELGRRVPQEQFLRSADEVLDAGGLLLATIEDVGKAKVKARVKHPDWFRDYARLEAKAVELAYFSTMTFPGVMQTEAYMRTLFSGRRPILDDQTIEERVAARIERQRLWTRWPPPTVNCVVEESVLRRPLGGVAVLREQLERLAELASLRWCEVQVMPTGCHEHPGVAGPFTLMHFRDRSPIAYVEVHDVNRLIGDRSEVHVLATKYGSIRAKALEPEASASLISEILGAL
ncbi:helix-turn-helix domain-containing protein [Yinghuangia seranimata]|uniref:helix-turn-helix domain-containing protein n=1 Tax=Yinghuangia seranimata TaxID=408067 RepID=UPI00248BE486|nr:helix-turn-helix transcriptional regulator [Yinghuangia seranimata]MDI2125603.1 helix-turn-helix transcriptional regulator [Yinghuangia seranimata]